MSEGSNKLFFGNIAFKATEDDLKSFCEKFGDIEEGNKNICAYSHYCFAIERPRGFV